MYADEFLQERLTKRREDKSLRRLSVTAGKIDFCSNDYLGIVKDQRLKVPGNMQAQGSTGSRLLSGNSALVETVEKEIASFHNAEAALIFNSGYDANTGLLSSIPQKGDTIIFDHLCHASIRDGIRLSFANAFSFVHNDLADLERKIDQASGNIFIVTESVFSMDGDTCPLPGLVSLAARYGAHLIIDEAHATGIIGNFGEGLVQASALQDKVFARVHTFGKALGCHGAAVLGSPALREYLLNFARSFIFTTALPDHSIAVIRESYRVFPHLHSERKHLQQLVSLFQAASVERETLISSTPLQGVMVPGNEAAQFLATQLQESGFDVRPILYPSVPKGKERLRIVLHAYNTEPEVVQLTDLLKELS